MQICEDDYLYTVLLVVVWAAKPDAFFIDKSHTTLRDLLTQNLRGSIGDIIYSPRRLAFNIGADKKARGINRFTVWPAVKRI